MVIESKFGNDYFGDLVIEKYPNLEEIVVQEESLMNLNSLKICNNKRLKIIEVENTEGWEEDGEWYGNGAFENVKSVIINSK